MAKGKTTSTRGKRQAAVLAASSGSSVAAPADMTASEAARAIRAGQLTSEALVEACVARIAEREPEIQAWAFLDREHALAQARERDAEFRSGRGAGILHGVPVGIKDVIETHDMPCGANSAIFKDFNPRVDAHAVAQLRAAGAVIFGKTVTAELASSTPGPTRNPHNTAHTPGGSSSGSAAAVACGMVPLALGTQTAGSVIRPASFCGVVGFKPTLGLVSRRGVLLQSHTLDTVGTFGRSVEDVALVTDAMAGADPEDGVSLRGARPRLLEIASAEPPLPPLLAFVKPPAWAACDPITREAFGELIAELGESVTEIELPSLAQAVECHQLVQGAENAAYYGPLRERQPDLVSEGLTARLDAGAGIAAHDYIRAVRMRETIYASIEDVLTQVSAILMPSALGPAPKGLGSTGDPIMNGMWTFLGMPAVSLPLLEADGMPIGVQLIGARGDDGRLLRTARWLARHLAVPG